MQLKPKEITLRTKGILGRVAVDIYQMRDYLSCKNA